MYFKTLPDDKKQLLLVKISVIPINTSVPTQIKKRFSMKASLLFMGINYENKWLQS